MGQSKRPATCTYCGVVGPPRGPKAIRVGWWRREPYKSKPDWLCPTCAPVAREKLRKQREAEDEARREKWRRRRIMMERRRQEEIRRSMTISKILRRCGG